MENTNQIDQDTEDRDRARTLIAGIINDAICPADQTDGAAQRIVTQITDALPADSHGIGTAYLIASLLRFQQGRAVEQHTKSILRAEDLGALENRVPGI